MQERIPDWGAKILSALQPKKKKHKTEKTLLTNLIKNFKMVHIKKKKENRLDSVPKAFSLIEEIFIFLKTVIRNN